MSLKINIKRNYTIFSINFNRKKGNNYVDDERNKKYENKKNKNNENKKDKQIIAHDVEGNSNFNLLNINNTNNSLDCKKESKLYNYLINSQNSLIGEKEENINNIKNNQNIVGK